MGPADLSDQLVDDLWGQAFAMEEETEIIWNLESKLYGYPCRDHTVAMPVECPDSSRDDDVIPAMPCLSAATGAN